jgi:hypothetical protein
VVEEVVGYGESGIVGMMMGEASVDDVVEDGGRIVQCFVWKTTTITIMIQVHFYVFRLSKRN